MTGARLARVSTAGNLLLIGIAALVLVALWWKAHTSSRETVLQFISWIDSLGWKGYIVFVIAQIAICMTGMLPASMLAVAAGGLYGIAVGFTLCAIAILMAASVAFLFSRYVLRERIRHILLSHEFLANVDSEIATSGWRLVFLFRLSPLSPFGVVSYAFGLSRIRTLDYMVGTLASLPALLAYVYTGAIADDAVLAVAQGQVNRGWIDWTILVGGFVATAATALYLSMIARRALARTMTLTNKPKPSIP